MPPVFQSTPRYSKFPGLPDMPLQSDDSPKDPALLAAGMRAIEYARNVQNYFDKYDIFGYAK